MNQVQNNIGVFHKLIPDNNCGCILCKFARKEKNKTNMKIKQINPRLLFNKQLGNIKVTIEQHAKAHKIAKKNKITVSEMVRQLIDNL